MQIYSNDIVVADEMETLPVNISKDLKKASQTMGTDEARYLVDLYYQMQDNRIASQGQIRSILQVPVREAKAMSKAAYGKENRWEEFIDQCAPAEPHEVISYFFDVFANIEGQLKKSLQSYAEAQRIGRWMLSIKGIGPVIAAGLLANIDIRRAPTAGHIWSYCGLNPDMVWEKGHKRPYNAKMKVLAWKIGQSFIKVQNKDDALYGHIYKWRLEYEEAHNAAGKYKEPADKMAEFCRKNPNKMVKSRPYYEQGLLPPSQLKSRAARYATKMFLSHLQQRWWELETGTPAAKPFAIAILEHAHEIEAPEMVD